MHESGRGALPPVFFRQGSMLRAHAGRREPANGIAIARHRAGEMWTIDFERFIGRVAH
jgi:hypothetical protein